MDGRAISASSLALRFRLEPPSNVLSMRPSAELTFAKAAAEVFEEDGFAPSPSLLVYCQIRIVLRYVLFVPYLSGRVRKVSKFTFVSSKFLKLSSSAEGGSHETTMRLTLCTELSRSSMCVCVHVQGDVANVVAYPVSYEQHS